jgi:hypothetical protein
VFGDWQAACDNLRRCHALGLPREDSETQAFLQLSRGADASAQPEAALILSFGSEDPEITVRIEFDPPAGESGLPREASASLGPEGLPRVTTPPDKVSLLIGALRRAEALARGGGSSREDKVLRIRVGTTAEGPAFATFPLVVAQSFSPLTKWTKPNGAPMMCSSSTRAR